jgi:hypothetical protein
MKHKIMALSACALLALTGCSKEIDTAVVGATKVEGTYNLWWFCHKDTSSLIFFEKITGDDEYVLVWPGACTPDGKAKDMSGSNPVQPNLPGDGN